MWDSHRTTAAAVDRRPLNLRHPRDAAAVTRKRCECAVVVGALLLAGTVCAAAAEGPSVQVQVAKAELRILHQTVTAFGRVQPDPHQVASIALPRAGLVGHLWVRLHDIAQ